MLRVAAVQLNSTADVARNLLIAGELIDEAASAGATLVVLPEMVNCLGSGTELRAGAEPFDGRTTQWARERASTHGIWLVAGSFIERHADGTRSNTSVLVSPAGEITASYRKVHLFDCAVEGAEFRESEITEPGSELVVADLDPVDRDPLGRDSVGRDSTGTGQTGIRVGMSICYDVRFPELYRILALRGATILVVPSAFTARTGPPHWEILLRARAIENQAFVIAAGQVGTAGPGLSFHGHSLIIDPWGVVLSDAGDASPTVVTAELDFDRLAAVRARLPSLAARRGEVYQWG